MRWIYAMALLMTACNKNQSPADSFPTSKIVFVRQTEHVNHLWMMDIDRSGVGSNTRRVTENTEAENYPSWSPDGTHLAFQLDKNGSAIYISDADGKESHRLSPTPGFDVTPSWSPDGNQIVYSRVQGLILPGQVPQTEIRIMNSDGSGDHVILPLTAFSVEPRWSVNDQIVFMSLMNGGQQIFIINADGSGLKQLTHEGSNGDPAWSPNGSQISFGSNREGNGRLNIFVMQADGTGVVQLTHFQQPFESGDTNWSADGKKITFEYDIDGHLQSDPDAAAWVWTMNANGQVQQSTAQPCSAVGCAPRWQPK